MSSNGQPPLVGEPAPDMTLPDQTGEPVRLGDVWSASPAGMAIVFLRHFG